MTLERPETVVVSRKTPDDGRLLIPEALAERLASAGPDLAVRRGHETAPARLHSITCSTCGKGASGSAPHVHSFVESPLLTSLVPGTEVVLRLKGEAGSVLAVE